jgi:outer membrane protein OmpA-like peptidoglycan-associated protein
MISEIYVREFIDSQWQTAVKLPFPINSENVSNIHPSVTFDRKSENEIIYFSSNRKGGRGAFDIWFTYRKQDGTYTKPRNLGTKINTAGNEITPYYHVKEHFLYFSSDGWPGIGGKDIYRSRGNATKWKKPEHLSIPINSPYDDTHPALLINETKGFFASNRPVDSISKSVCCEDIYSFQMAPASVHFLKGKLYNEENTSFLNELEKQFKIENPLVKEGDPLSKIKLELFELDEESEEYLIAETESDSKGEYEFETEPGKQYIVKAYNFGFAPKKIHVDTREIIDTDSLILQPMGLNYMVKDLNLVFDIYFEHDKAHLNQQAQHLIDTSLYKIVQLIPNAKFEIGAHTDNTGNENYNLKLSQKRASSVIEYLSQKGILKERLVAKGYGESKPVASNENPDGSDNPEGRRLNRRTEIKIIGRFEASIENDQKNENSTR